MPSSVPPVRAGPSIVSADHPGFASRLYPDGYHFQGDTLLAPKPTGVLRDDALKSWDWLEKEVFPTWMADVSYVLDKIENGSARPDSNITNVSIFRESGLWDGHLVGRPRYK